MRWRTLDSLPALHSLLWSVLFLLRLPFCFVLMLHLWEWEKAGIRWHHERDHNPDSSEGSWHRWMLRPAWLFVKRSIMLPCLMRDRKSRRQGTVALSAVQLLLANKPELVLTEFSHSRGFSIAHWAHLIIFWILIHLFCFVLVQLYNLLIQLEYIPTSYV